MRGTISFAPGDGLLELVRIHGRAAARVMRGHHNSAAAEARIRQPLRGRGSEHWIRRCVQCKCGSSIDTIKLPDRARQIILAQSTEAFARVVANHQRNCIFSMPREGLVGIGAQQVSVDNGIIRFCRCVDMNPPYRFSKSMAGSSRMDCRLSVPINSAPIASASFSPFKGGPASIAPLSTMAR